MIYPTDQQLEKMAEELAEEHNPNRDSIYEVNRRIGYEVATLAALKDYRESLRLLEEVHSLYRENGYAGEENFQAHIALLKSRLGIAATDSAPAREGEVVGSASSPAADVDRPASEPGTPEKGTLDAAMVDRIMEVVRKTCVDHGVQLELPVNTTFLSDLRSRLSLLSAPVSPWVSTKERLPMEWESVLVRIQDNDRAYIDVWMFCPDHKGWHNGTVTHWMTLPDTPLPTPPTEDLKP